MCYTIHNNTLGNCAHFFRKRETMTTKDYQTRRPLRIFLSYFRPHRGLFLLDLGCAFLFSEFDEDVARILDSAQCAAAEFVNLANESTVPESLDDFPHERLAALVWFLVDV